MEQKSTISQVLHRHNKSQWQKNLGELFKFFCNNVFLGQWELAKTAVPTLVKEFSKNNTEIDIVHVLISVCEYPFSQSLGSNTVPSPHHLSWLCLQELIQLSPSLSTDKKSLIATLTKDVDFRLTLWHLHSEKENHMKELYVYFRKNVLKLKTPTVETDFGGGDFLSNGTKDFLKQALMNNASLCDNVMKSLMVDEGASENRNNELLQAIYLDCVNCWLDKLDDESNEQSLCSGELVTNALHVLAFYNPVPYWNYLQLRQLFTRLLTLTFSGAVPSLTPERIVSSISGRQTPYLMDEFCKIYHEVSQLTITKSENEQGDYLNPNQRHCLHVLNQVDRNICWRDFYISCHKRGVHFLAEILELSLALIKSGKFIQLQDLLSYLELQPLRPAVLLMGWSLCLTSTNARTLLDTLWDDSVECYNPRLANGCRRLAYHLDLIQWCLERAKPLIENSASSCEATELLQGLETHSVLYMLHQSTSLASLDHSEVLQLLTNVSASNRKGGKKKAVSFQDESKSSLNSVPEPINIDKQKDITIYRSYCAIKNVIDAIMFCVDNFEHELMNPVQVKRTLRTKKLHRNFLTEQTISSSEGEDSSNGLDANPSEADRAKQREDSQQFVKLYEQMVTKKLKETQEHLSHLQPLNYRLEIMEDIFSLLFVTHEDLSDSNGVAELETDEDITGSKHNNLEIVHQDSFVMSEDESVNDKSKTELSEKLKVESSPEEKSPPKATVGTSNVSSSCSLDYDAPFVDSFQKQSYPLQTGESPQSSYFTLSPELQVEATKCMKQQKQVLETVKETHEEDIQLPRKSRKRKKRQDSDPSPNTIVGFLINEYVVRDILHLLKDAISNLNVAKFSISGQTSNAVRKDNSTNLKGNTSNIDPNLEAVLQVHIPTSISQEALPKRIIKLTQAVHEAWWRFQLVAHEAFPRQPSQILPQKVFVTDSDLNFLPVCEGNSFRLDADADQSSSSEQKVSRSHTTLSQSNIITKMMANPESLLTHSLVKGNPSQAAEVMKLFKITEKTAETCEVSFATIYQVSSSKIWDLEPEVKESSQKQVKVGKRSITALNKAASVGVATAVLSNIVEDLLANPCVPPIPRPKSQTARETFASLFNLDPSSALLFDLLCSSCRTWDTCSNMIDIIKTKTKLLKHDPRHSDHNSLSNTNLINSPPTSEAMQSPASVSPSGSATSPPLTSIIKPKNLKAVLQGVTSCNELLWYLYDLIHSSNGTTPFLSTHNLYPTSTSKLSLQHHFHSAYSSFRVENLRIMNATLAELRKAVDYTLLILEGASSADHHVDICVEDPTATWSTSPRGSFSGSFSGSGASQGSNTATGGARGTRTRQSVNQNPLHVAVKQLMYTMERHVPGDGLTYILSGKGTKGSGAPIKNYLLSLYEHVKEMSYLVAECEGKYTEVASNYFKVLNEGPISILGRLMFEKKMPPVRLEAVAEKLSLNLTHTIVHSCCPKIPSKHPPAVSECGTNKSERMSATRVYNIQKSPEKTQVEVSLKSDETQKGSSLNPESLVRSILSSLVKLMEDVSVGQNAKGLFDLSSAEKLVQMPEYNQALESVDKLNDVDLNNLATMEERICFYVNLANLMILHCHLSHILTRLQIHLKTDAKGVTSDNENVELCPMGSADFVAYFSSFSYQVGQLQIISVFDLLTSICCNGLSHSSQWGCILNCRKFALSPHDPWRLYCPSSEPRLIFVLNMGCASSPPLQVLQPENVLAVLDKSMKNYLDHSIVVSMEQEKVSLPELLVWHEKNFVTETKLPSRDSHHGFLLKWAAQHVNPEKMKQLEQLFNIEGTSENLDTNNQIDLPFRVEIDRFDNGFIVSFDIKHVKIGHTIPQRDATNAQKSRTHLYRLSTSLDRSGHSWNLELPSYNLTPVTLDYVKQNSLLVATMVSLVCSDNLDNIEQFFTADHFNDSSSSAGPASLNTMYPGLIRTHANSDISLVDIRSYRYHRLTDDYPILQRHLLHYILPLAGADNPELLSSTEPILKFVTNVIDDQVKLCMFSLPNSDQFQCVIQDMANHLLEEHKWIEILNIIKSLPESVVAERLYLQNLHDFVLSCWAISQVGLPGCAPKVGDKLRKFYNLDVQARTVLTVCHDLPLDLSIDLLDLCMTSLKQNSGLWEAVCVKYKETSVYSKIMDSVKTLRIKLSMKDVPVLSMSLDEQHLHKVLEKFTERGAICSSSQEKPREVLLVLEKTGDFATARAWAEIHKLPQDIFKDIEELHLHHVLTQDQPDTVIAFQLLDTLRMKSEPECLSICLSLAMRLTQPRDIKFVVSYVLKFLVKHLDQEDVENFRLRKIGAKALMHIPASIQSEYTHLISCPHLILEQLLMNMKAELAGQIFEQIKLDFMEIKELKLRLAQDQFNNLLATYANKAIEVNFVQVEDKPLGDNSTNNAGLFEESSRDDSPSRLSISSSKLSIDRRRSDRSASPRQDLTKLRRESKFVAPTQPPSQEHWVPDSATSVCMVCRLERFSMFNRRHHCRRCGRVVCAACSTKQLMTMGVSARACDECYEQTHSSSDYRTQDEHEIYSRKIKEQLTGTSTSPSRSPALQRILNTDRQSPDRLQKSISVINQVNQSWKLRSDLAYSDQIRSEFYYEQAPSVSLCISLLKQHSSRGEAGKLILSMCDKLSTYLAPISPGVPNPEIDYSLIISVMKQLLFQAKIDFLLTGNTGQTEMCDLYLGRVDLLNVMVKANYQDLPTIKELTKQDTVRRLRDKLIADERLTLAMEVSTKCGIDPAGVWSAMGFACLHLGDFLGARDKFGHCLKVPADKNQTSASQSRLLGEILDFLDTVPSSGITEVQRILTDPGSICDIKTLLIPSVGEENRIESMPYQECLFYLTTYGSYMDHICFLRQHSYWMKAAQFTIDHHCSSDVFVLGLMVPAMTSGEMSRLLEQMLMLDPTLEKWLVYLTATCKHLLKQKYFNTLYKVQLFMKDYIRAAMTCITHFYQRGATSYLDLSGRLQFLFTAQQHLQAYQDPSQWGSVRHPLSAHSPVNASKQSTSWEKQVSDSTARMTLPPEEVKKHIRTIGLQIEVTKFLEQCLTQSLGGAGSTSVKFVPKSGQISTLFGNGAARTELVSMVVLSGSDFSAGFDLGIRIVKECRLNPTVIFTHCSRELAKQGRFPDINTLIQGLIKQQLVDDDGVDEIVGASLLIIADSHSQTQDESDNLIQLLKNDSNKINAFILCGKLRSAYLLAVKRDRVDDVQRIAGAAQRLRQSAVINICKKWLEQHQK